MIWMAIFLIVLFGFIWFEFGFFILRHDGRWCLATRVPQICWTVGASLNNGLNKAQSTGWHKFDKIDIWVKQISKEKL